MTGDTNSSTRGRVIVPESGMAQGEPIARVEALDPNGWHRKRHNRTHAPQQTSGWALAAVSFVYLSVGCPFQLPPKFGAKPLGRFFRRRRRVSSPVDSPNSSFLRRFPAFSPFPQQGGRACNMEARREYQAALLTPQKNGRGPCPTPVIFLCQAWYLRKNPSGA